eukprot:COSAG04_NODE_4606_length_1990_cov_3.144897_1_plen_106_part_00
MASHYPYEYDPYHAAEWATIEHASGVEPPPLPPPLDVEAAVRAGVQPLAGMSQSGHPVPACLAVAPLGGPLPVDVRPVLDSPLTAAVQLQGRVRRPRRPGFFGCR